jgi:hypothetical protein
MPLGSGCACRSSGAVLLDGLYAEYAAQPLGSLGNDDLDSIPEDIGNEESSFCLVFYLPNHKLVRVLPGYGFELQTW